MSHDSFIKKNKIILRYLIFACDFEQIVCSQIFESESVSATLYADTAAIEVVTISIFYTNMVENIAKLLCFELR